MKKTAIVVGTRPEVIKLAPLFLEMKKSKKLRPILINTGQHAEMTTQMLKWFGIKEHYNLKLMKKNQSLSGLTSRVIESTTKVFEKLKPDVVVVEGDTTTVMAASLAAFYLKIPVAHVEAGLRTADVYNPFPEEMSRRLVSRLAKYHFAPTRQASLNLKKEGITKNVFHVGNTVIDALLFTKRKIKSGFRVQDSELMNIDFKKKKVVLVTMHRRENWGKPHREIALTLKKILDENPDVQILLPLHKNPKVRKEIVPVLGKHERAVLTEPLDYVPFVFAMKNSYLILTDSGGVQEEAPSLGKPVLVLRTTTERPEGIKSGNAKLVGINPDKVFREANKLLNSKVAYKKMVKPKNPYGDGNSAKKITKLLSIGI